MKDFEMLDFEKLERIGYSMQGHCQYEDRFWDVLTNFVFKKHHYSKWEGVLDVDLGTLVPYFVLAGAIVVPSHDNLDATIPRKRDDDIGGYSGQCLGFDVYVEKGKYEVFEGDFIQLISSKSF